MGTQAEPSLPSDLLEVDWELLGTRNARVRSSYHWYPQQGRHEIAGILIGCLSDRGALVLDPCCGIGNTLVEAKRQGREPIGGDVNPVASLVTNARLLGKDKKQWNDYVETLRERIAHHLVTRSFDAENANFSIPNYSENRLWYHEETFDELFALWKAICDIKSPYALVAEATFSAILRSVSSQRGPANRIADNCRPIILKYRPVVGLFFAQLHDYFPDAAEKTEENEDSQLHRAWVQPGATALAALPEAFVDLVITHLPELGAVDYVRSQRLTSLWFGWDVNEYASAEIGARYRHRRAAALTEYYRALDEIFTEIARVVKPRRWCALILSPAFHRKQMTIELSRIMSYRNFEIIARLGGRRGRGDITGQHDTPREEIIVAWRKDLVACMRHLFVLWVSAGSSRISLERDILAMFATSVTTARYGLSRQVVGTSQ
jgi:SAM-dependent methyltransferase